MRNKREICYVVVFLMIFATMLGVTKSRPDGFKLKQYNEYVQIEKFPVFNGLSEEEVTKLEEDKYLIIYDENDTLSVGIKENIRKVFEITSKNYELCKVTQRHEINEEITGIIICNEAWMDIEMIDEIFDYVNEGGSVMFAIRPNPDENYDECLKKVGILKTNGFTETMGIKLKTNLIIQSEGMEVSGEAIVNSSLNLTLSKEVNVHATSIDDIPIVWDKTFGKGKIVVVNGSFMQDKINRGILTNIIALMSDAFIYPIINAGVIFLDDFPGPIPEGNIGKYYPQIDLTIEQFYKEVWWPNIIGLSNQFDFKYTAVYIRGYGNRVVPQFEPEIGNVRENLYYFVPELIKVGGELGYHGFNHQPYVFSQVEADSEGYNAWKSADDIQLSLELYRDYTLEMMKNYDVRTYVPPSNMLSDEVREMFPQIAPWIKVIASLYEGSDGLGVYEQEFEVAEDGIIEFPRFTSGYLNSYTDAYILMNGITMYGVFSHFIHPDDILDKDRREGGENWEEILERFTNNLERTIGKTDWVRKMTLSDAAEELKKFSESQVYIENNGDVIDGYINHFRKDMYFILRTEKEIKSAKNCEYKEIDTNMYWIYTENPKFRIELEDVED